MKHGIFNSDEEIVVNKYDNQIDPMEQISQFHQQCIFMDVVNYTFILLACVQARQTYGSSFSFMTKDKAESNECF